MAGKEPVREQFYLEASLLQLKISTVQQVAGKEPVREQFYMEASLLKLKNIYAKW